MVPSLPRFNAFEALGAEPLRFGFIVWPAVMAARDIAVASVASVLGIGAALLVGYLRKPRIQIAKKVAVPGLGNIDVKSEVSAGKTHVTLDWNALLGIPARLPFCSAVITETGTIYVSGAVGARKGSDGKPTVVPGGPYRLAFARAQATSASADRLKWMRSPNSEPVVCISYEQCYADFLL
ncbi:hypothetical protein AK812_SmicGene8879 [Symbiodinium microadriaticum]|uniref:Uncharacterized protein n=1 Tax=Symbiodinium microadriaticum TaxID=2951 RepID=A0A1Q9EJU1_SYMMI|nr:hypothetical protein AK812_SmicGene8879 [Symbiodinium microadriaticum]